MRQQLEAAFFSAYVETVWPTSYLVPNQYYHLQKWSCAVAMIIVAVMATS